MCGFVTCRFLAPRHHYDKKTGELVLDLLKENVQSRGLELPEKNRVHRRPRTCASAKGLGIGVENNIRAEGCLGFGLRVQGSEALDRTPNFQRNPESSILQP